MQVLDFQHRFWLIFCFKQCLGRGDCHPALLQYPVRYAGERQLPLLHPVTCVPVPVIKDRCEKNCCSIATVPLRVCKAVTTHKSQGMTVGPGHVWERLVITLPRKNSRNKTCGSELVAFSRVTDLQHLAIADHEGVPNTLQHYYKIGKGLAATKKHEFLHELHQHSLQSVSTMKTEIAALDTVHNSFHEGCAFLLNWHRTHHIGNN